MSAIAGIIHFDGAPVEPGQIEQMTAALALHGPDGCVNWVNGSAAFGHCMLRTTPESVEETQPLANETGTLVLVMDGRVDNWEELRKQLLARKVVLRTRADAELVLRAYEVWGAGLLAHIEGDFALVIWDQPRQQAFCARDRFGNRQLHYFRNGHTLVFASRPLAILTLPFVAQLRNDGVLADYLVSQCYSGSETFWQGINQLLPSQQMLVDDRGAQLQEYWQPDVWASISYRRDEDYCEHYLELLSDVMRRMSRSLAPLACEVSGGLDSSAVFGMAMQLQRQRKLLAPGIEGYGLSFPDDPAANELDYMRAVGAHWGCTIQEVPPTYKPLAWFRQRARHWREFPGAPHGIMCQGLYEKARMDGCRVVLSGWGGDEWLGGSRSYYADTLAAHQWRQLYECLRTDCREFGVLTGLRWLISYGVLPLLPFAVRTRLRRLVTSTIKYGVDTDAWLEPALRHLIKQRRQQYQTSGRQITARVGQRSQLNKLHDIEWLQHAEHGARLVADAGLELRRPLCDARIIQFALATPEHVRLRGKTDRALHRQAMTGILPELVRMRSTKADFTGPFHHYLPAMADLLTREIPARRPDWVSVDGARAVYRMASNPEHLGWPEWMLWQLFGCDAIFDV